MKRIFLWIVIIVVVAYGLKTCFFKNSDGADSDQRSDKDATVAVLSVNDMHSAIDMMPRFAALTDSLRQVYPDLLVFSAGDNRTGNPINDQYDPTNHPMIALMNKVGFDLCAIGNHEWDGGVDALQRNIEEAKFPFLCANVVVPGDMKLEVKPYEILENQGLKIAVLGLVEVGAGGIPGVHPKLLAKLRFKRPEEVLPEYQYLRNQCDVFILLSHLGYEEDLEVARQYSGFDAILGGHSHTLVEYPKKENGVMVTQAGSGLRNATLTLFKVRNGKVVDVTATTLDVEHFGKKNHEVQSMLDGFNDDSRFNMALATATTPFQNREELGCMVTDAIREVSGADFAFNNTGGLRIDRMKKGPITIKDVYNIDPFNNEIVVYKMKGSQLERFIMESYKKNGRYPSFVSGMSYEVNTASDGYPKSVSITLDHGRFSREAIYTVAMNSFMASTVRFESVDDGESQFMTSEEMVIEFLKNHKTVSYQGVSRTK
ncbi:MAG: bifunctional metallophosphatase/5'-nucleotidase [Bacteroidales bacterium]|nr:bifunctional metallophosphatase/5'-nucleotidase [Bacteroidales bacterium]